MEVEHRTEKTRSWRAWAGTREDLRRIGDVAEKLIASRRETLTESHRLWLQNEAEGYLSPSGREDALKNIEPNAERFANEIRLEASVSHGTDSSIGPVAEVLKELDRRTVTRYSIRAVFPNSVSRESLVVDFTWPYGNQRGGVSIQVQSRDIGWANQVFAMLSAEVGKGGPKWHSAHTPLMRAVIYITTMAALVAGITLAVAPLLGGENRAARVVGVAALAMAVVLFILFFVSITYPAYEKIFPPVELLGEDYTATAGRRIAFFGSLILSVLLGIFVNLIS